MSSAWLLIQPIALLCFMSLWPQLDSSFSQWNCCVLWPRELSLTYHSASKTAVFHELVSSAWLIIQPITWLFHDLVSSAWLIIQSIRLLCFTALWAQLETHYLISHLAVFHKTAVFHDLVSSSWLIIQSMAVFHNLVSSAWLIIQPVAVFHNLVSSACHSAWHQRPKSHFKEWLFKNLFWLTYGVHVHPP